MAPEPVAPVNGFDDLVVDDEPAPPIDDGQPRRSRFDEALELAKRVLDEGVAQRRQDEAERAERQRREEEQAARLRQLLAPLAPLPVSPPLPAPRVPEAHFLPGPPPRDRSAMGPRYPAIPRDGSATAALLAALSHAFGPAFPGVFPIYLAPLFGAGQGARGLLRRPRPPAGRGEA